MTFFRWTGAISTDAGAAGNWLDLATGAADAAPGVGDVALLAGAGTLTGTASLGLLEAYAPQGGGFALDGAFAAREVADRGTLAVDGGRLSAHVLDVGAAGGKQFAVLDMERATVAAYSQALDVDVANGRVLIGGQGAGANATLALGQGTATVGTGGQLDIGTGALTGKADSAIVVGSAAGFGTLQLLGNTSTLATAGRLVVGQDGATASVGAAFGGTISVGDGEGAALVLGAGSDRSAGLLLAHSALVRVDGQAQVGESGAGTLMLSGSRLITHGLVIGDAQQGQGVVSAQGGLWSDYGDVTVGNSGFGSLALAGTAQDRGASVIGGALRVGAMAEGVGRVVVAATNLAVEGATTIGSTLSSFGTSSVVVDDGAHWMSGTQSVSLAFGDTLSVTGAGSALSAGALSVGFLSQVGAGDGGSLVIGGSVAGTAASVLGTLAASGGATLAVTGATTLGSFDSGTRSPPSDLLVAGATATLTAANGYALDALPGAVVGVNMAGSLGVAGGIEAQDATVVVSNATLRSSAGSTFALAASYASTITVYESSLTTTGFVVLGGGSDPHSTELISTGSTLVSNAASGGFGGQPVVAIDGGTQAAAMAQLQDSDWTVAGSVGVGEQGAGVLDVQGGQVAIGGTLAIGSTFGGVGVVTGGAHDTIVAGGTLASGETGVSAEFIALAGMHSSITAGGLRVGSPGASGGGLGVSQGSVSITGLASLDSMLGLANGASVHVGVLATDALGSVSGQGSLSAGTIDGAGTITLSGTITATVGSITGGVELAFGDAGFSQSDTVTLTGVASSSSSLAFEGVGLLVAPTIADVGASIVDWGSNALIDFIGEQIASVGYENGVLSLYDASSALLGTLHFGGPGAGQLSTGNFGLHADGTGGSYLFGH